MVQFQRAHISSGQLSALFAAIVGVPGKISDFCPTFVALADYLIILLELTTHVLNHTRQIMSACLQMQIISVVGASTNTGFQNKQQRLKSLNLSGTDVSKVITLAPLPPFWWHILINNRYSHNSQWKVQYQDHSWFDLPGGSQVACCRNCETERDNSHLHMSHFVWVSLIPLFRLAFFREQIKEMLLALSNSPTNLSLTKLNIGGNDLSGKYFAQQTKRH